MTTQVYGAVNAEAALYPTTVKTSAYTANPGDLVACDISAGGFTATLPNAPGNGTRVAVKVIATNATATNLLTVACQGSDRINTVGGSVSFTVQLLNQGVTLQYSAGIWYATDDSLPLSGVRNLMPDWLNVKAYGAAGNGTADDTAAIQAALNAAASGAGGALYFPAGSYRTTSPLTWTSTRPLALIGASTKGLGAGTGGSAIMMAFAPGHALDIQNASWFRMQDLDVIVTAANTGGYGVDHVGVYVGHVTWGEIDRININYSGVSQAQSLVAGIKVYNCPGFNINRAAINTAAQGVWFTGPASGSIANLCDIENTHIGTVAGSGGACVQMDGASGTVDIYNLITFQGDRAFWMTGTAPAFMFATNIQANNPSVCGLQFDAGQSVYLDQIWLTAFQHAASAAIHGINVGTGFSGSLQVLNSSLGGLGGHGIWLQGGNGYTIANTQIGHVGAFSSNTYDDVHIGAAASNVTVTGCHFDTDYALAHSGSYPNRSGVYVEAGASNVLVDDNLFGPTYSTAPVINNAASGSVRFRGNIGYNPVGAVTAPTLGASPSTLTNTTGVDCTVIVSAGTVSAISVSGVATGLTSGSFSVPAGGTITITYTAAPTLVWIGS